MDRSLNDIVEELVRLYYDTRSSNEVMVTLTPLGTSAALFILQLFEFQIHKLFYSHVGLQVA